jgi:hypothetical protein
LVVVEEDTENKTVWLTTPKRESKIKVFIPQFSGYSFWKIRYEDGTEIPELSGSFITKREALKALDIWEEATKISKTKYQRDNWGHEEPPVLKRKKVKVGTVDNLKTG